MVSVVRFRPWHHHPHTSHLIDQLLSTGCVPPPRLATPEWDTLFPFLAGTQLCLRKFFGARRAYIAQSLLTSYGR